ncbi:hypothetical protein REPUB_Repub15cG0131100 [Reevesia pubescens]
MWSFIDELGREVIMENGDMYAEANFGSKTDQDMLVQMGFCSLSDNLNSTLPDALRATPHGNAVISKEQILHQEAALCRANLQETEVNANSSNGRVMLIDGTSVIYRAYYKLLAKLHHGYLSHADGNGDWVLTIFTALSLIIDVLEFVPSHVAVVFDHDGEI